jgi:hypothetical protein
VEYPVIVTAIRRLGIGDAEEELSTLVAWLVAAETAEDRVFRWVLTDRVSDHVRLQLRKGFFGMPRAESEMDPYLVDAIQQGWVEMLDRAGVAVVPEGTGKHGHTVSSSSSASTLSWGWVLYGVRPVACPPPSLLRGQSMMLATQ